MYKVERPLTFEQEGCGFESQRTKQVFSGKFYLLIRYSC